MAKEVVATVQAAAAIGPYSQAVRAGQLVYTAGQIPLTPDGELIAGDVAAQTRQVMENLKAILAAAGATLDDVLKTTIYCVDLADFGTINEVYGSYFGAAPPARSTVQVAALPKGARVEIEAVALRSA